MTGVVCEAITAFGRVRSRCRRYSDWNDPEPNPCIGRSAQSSSPPSTSFDRPTVALFTSRGLGRSPLIASAAAPPTRPIAITAANPIATGRRVQRRAATTASPASSAANDDCEKVSTSEAQSTASAAASSTTSRRRELHATTAAIAIITSARKRP